MLSFLLNKCITKEDDPNSPEVRSYCGTVSGSVGIVANLFLFAVKLAAGIVSSSISIMADAVNNLSDAGSSIVTLAGFRLSTRKADKHHPFGHGRIEYLSGVAVSLLIILMGAGLVQESIERILSPEETVLTWFTAVVLVLSIIIKLFLYQFNKGLASRLTSAALHSTAQDSRNDCIATSVVLLCLFIQHFTGVAVDGWCGLAVAIFVLWSGIRSLTETIDPLLGTEPDPRLVASITDIVLKTPHVLGMHDLVIHDYGPEKRMMTLHVEVDSHMKLTSAHNLADSLEKRMEQKFDLQTVIHIDPVEKIDPLLETKDT